MTRRLSSLLQDNARKSFTGRERELAQLMRMFEADQPPVWFIEGIAGIGKSRLLAQFETLIDDGATRVIRLDCRTIEPTADAFLAAVAQEAEVSHAGAEETVEAIAAGATRTLLILDAYESFQLLDSWMRTIFLPLLPEDFRTVMASRYEPGACWLSAPEWAGLFRRLELGLLSEQDALSLLAGRGLSPELARRINRVAQGHPLALQLASSTSQDGFGDQRVEAETIPAMIDRLAQLYLADAPDKRGRRLLEAASVVRRVTRPLIAAMLPDAEPGEAFSRLERLSFIERRADGLVLHESVQSSIAQWLQSSDPEQFLAWRQLAWRYLRSKETRSVDLWRTTADMLFMLQNPSLREGFFPSGGSACQVAPAHAADWPDIRKICLAHEGPEALAFLERLWTGHKNGFGTVWDEQGRIVGYTVGIPADAIDRATARNDPVLRAWVRHLEIDPLPPRQRAIFGRTWLGRDSGERPSAAQAAVWIDAKRAYMELRPRLRRMYICQRDFSFQDAALGRLGFVDLPDATVRIDGTPYFTRMLDFGPGSVDGWLSGLVAAEVGIEDEGLLDPGARSLTIDGQSVKLTKLEFAVMQYLSARSGQVVSRADLLAGVWGTEYLGGSNVVDVLVRGIRKKLGGRAGELETVRGAGYRLNGSKPRAGGG